MKKIAYFSILSLIFWIACKPEIPDPPKVIKAVYDATPYELKYGHLPDPNLPADNPLTIEGVKLGKMLFYETKLSSDGSQSCASCHHQPDGFSDSLRFSKGVKGLEGARQAMAIFNMAWHSNGFFWDGRATLLRDQALLPIQDPLEMDETLENVVAKLGADTMYTNQFIRAFDDSVVSPRLISLALEQFMNSIVSYQSKYDKYLIGEANLTLIEERGRQLYFMEYNAFFPEASGADCQHCHGGLNLENDDYLNNGLDSDADFTDFGLEKVTGDPADRAKFKIPSLRNVAVTPPYMHDGRFKTLEEVIDHYNSGIQYSSTVDPTVENTRQTGLRLDAQDKQDLINFLKTLTDEAYLTNEEYKSPF
jgi:cytochrome c peroxidase